MFLKVCATMWMIGVVLVAKELSEEIKSDLAAETAKSKGKTATEGAE